MIKLIGVCVIAILISLAAACESVRYVKSELTGSAQPDGGTQENVPPSKTYNTSAQAVRRAALQVLDEQGYVYEENPSTGTIKTEPKLLTDTRKFAFAGATYSAKLFIKLEGAKITYRAKFDKKSSVTEGAQNIEYPEKENELRKEFFAQLDKRLGSAVVKDDVQKAKSLQSAQKASSDVENSETMSIAEIQKRLLDLGYQPGRLDGMLGKKTISALKKFQKDNNLTVTGKPDSDTIRSLRNGK